MEDLLRGTQRNEALLQLPHQLPAFLVPSSSPVAALPQQQTPLAAAGLVSCCPPLVDWTSLLLPPVPGLQAPGTPPPTQQAMAEARAAPGACGVPENGPSLGGGGGEWSSTIITERSGESNTEMMKAAKKGGGRGKTKAATRARFAFETRSENDILDDGYRWRKYGQKAVKNSAFPRSYYRCTHHTCNVKKQVQRLAKDTSIVVTTYEGVHNHPCEKLMEALTPILRQLQFLSQIQ